MGVIRDARGRAIERRRRVGAILRPDFHHIGVHGRARASTCSRSSPPARYQLWAQAVTFATERAELTLDGHTPPAATWHLKPLADYEAQLTGVEWYDALPEDTTDHDAA